MDVEEKNVINIGWPGARDVLLVQLRKIQEQTTNLTKKKNMCEVSNMECKKHL